MPSCPDSTATSCLSRRQALGVMLGGAVALASSACTPATLLLDTYPDRYRSGATPTVTALRAFVDTVVPGSMPAAEGVVGVLQDTFYPLGEYTDFLASDLDRRARRRHDRPFARLSPKERAGVVRRALDGDAVTRKLYTGAAFLTQVAVYGGAFDDRAGCALIGFPGGYHLEPPSPLPASQRGVARPLTIDGNPA